MKEFIMQIRSGSYLDRRERIRRGDKNSAHPEQSIVTRIPHQASSEGYLATSPHPDVYRQALQVILETPQMEQRLNYVTAGMIVTILGSWLTGSIAKSRPLTMFTDLLLVFASLAFAGLLVGIMLGEGILPLNIIPILLFGLLGILIFVVVITDHSCNRLTKTEFPGKLQEWQTN
jgi:hypothetical protein